MAGNRLTDEHLVQSFFQSNVLTDRRLLLKAMVASGVCVHPFVADAAATAAGHVVTVSGEAVAQLDLAKRALEPNGQVFIGDRIATGEGARAAIRLGRATDLRLGARARITIDRFILDAGGTITLGAGALLLDKEPSGSEIGIRSSYGLIAVRGTRVFAGPSNGVFGVFVARGHVVVTAAGHSVTVNAGQGTDIARRGARPTPAASWGQPRIAAALASVG